MAEDYEDRFVSLLRNRLQVGDDDRFFKRDRGFVVIVPGNKSLAPLEALCVRDGQFQCFTARFRVSAGAVFGTVLSALAHDLVNEAGSGVTKGVYAPRLETSFGIEVWEFLENLVPPELALMENGVLEVDLVRTLLAQIDEATRSVPNMRFVLFCEIVGKHENTEEWERARSAIFPNLPEPVGLVFSGAPDGFRLIEDRATAPDAAADALAEAVPG